MVSPLELSLFGPRDKMWTISHMWVSFTSFHLQIIEFLRMKQFFYVQWWKVLIAKLKPDDNKSENRRVTSNPLRCIKRQQQPTPYPKTTATPRTKAKHQLSRKLKGACQFACRPSVRPSVCPFVSNLLTFHLLLKNNWITFIQTWHKAFLSKIDSGIFKTKAMSFSKGR